MSAYTVKMFLEALPDGNREWVAHVAELPDCEARADTFLACEKAIDEAIEAHVQALRADGLPIPPVPSEGEPIDWKIS